MTDSAAVPAPPSRATPDDLVTWLRNELDHAAFNDHVVTGQGFPGPPLAPPEPGVSVRYIEACLARWLRERQTERDQLEAMFTRAGVAYSELDGARRGSGSSGRRRARRVGTSTIEVVAEPGNHDPDPVVGYGWFTAAFTFTDDGALRQVGVWE